MLTLFYLFIWPGPMLELNTFKDVTKRFSFYVLLCIDAEIIYNFLK